MPRPVIVLFRRELTDAAEREAAARWLPTFDSRTAVPEGALVIGRYTNLPFYEELERDLAHRGAQLVHDHSAHRFLADIARWSGPPQEDGGLLGGLTPPTWTDWVRLPVGAYVVKGRTNSRKQRWATHMFAPTREEVPRVAQRLWDDTFLAEQGLVVRAYVPLRQLAEGLNGLPITNEWRTFWLVDARGEPVLLATGFYWATHPEVEAAATLPEHVVTGVASEAARRLAPYARFFVLDLAEGADGRWWIIEANDGQMSGLALVEPDLLYRRLSELLQDGATTLDD